VSLFQQALQQFQIPQVQCLAVPKGNEETVVAELLAREQVTGVHVFQNEFSNVNEDKFVRLREMLAQRNLSVANIDPLIATLNATKDDSQIECITLAA